METRTIKIEEERMTGRNRQRGIVIPLVAVGMLAMMAVAGLSLDASHTLANKTRLQNTVDAAALAAAIEIDDTGNAATATTEALTLFGQNSDAIGNHEMDSAYDAGDIAVTVQYSATLDPFVPGAPDGPYARVAAQNFDVGTTLSRVLGITEIEVRASAVAGPSPTLTNEICDVAPLLVCAEDTSDPTYFGFDPNEVKVLKDEPGNHADVGPGNYKLLDLGCPQGGGGACVRKNMAGEYDACLTPGNQILTKPGVTAGPTSQGMNTRFGQYQGGQVNITAHPPDVITSLVPSPGLTATDDGSCPGGGNGNGNGNGNGGGGNGGGSSGPTQSQVCWGNQLVTHASDIPAYNHDAYDNAASAAPYDYAPPTGAYERRVMALPVADCSGDDTGRSLMDIHGFACFFIMQPVVGGNDKHIYGQFIESCGAGGNPGNTPGNGPGPYIIQLYNDVLSGDS